MAGLLDVDQLTLLRPVYEAIRAADVVLDYTVNSRGAQKYNVDFHNLSMYYGKTIFARVSLTSREAVVSVGLTPVPSRVARRGPGGGARTTPAPAAPPVPTCPAPRTSASRPG